MTHSLDGKTLYIVQDGEVTSKMEGSREIEIGMGSIVEEMEDIVLMVLSRFQSGSDAVAIVTDCSGKAEDDWILPFVGNVTRVLEIGEQLDGYTEEEMKADSIKLH